MIFGAEGAENFFRPLNIAENFSDFGHDPRKEKRLLHPVSHIHPPSMSSPGLYAPQPQKVLQRSLIASLLAQPVIETAQIEPKLD